jgi:predicted nuclease of predicted toxin-antitoxin system
VRVLLDENFPLALLRSLQADGMETEHIITLGWRGATDDTIRERLIDADVVFLTQDDDFLFSPPTGSTVVVSRVRQARRIADPSRSGGAH